MFFLKALLISEAYLNEAEGGGVKRGERSTSRRFMFVLDLTNRLSSASDALFGRSLIFYYYIFISWLEHIDDSSAQVGHKLHKFFLLYIRRLELQYESRSNSSSVHCNL